MRHEDRCVDIGEVHALGQMLVIVDVGGERHHAAQTLAKAQPQLQRNDAALGESCDGDLIVAKAVGHFGFNQLRDGVNGGSYVVVAGEG